MTEIVTKKEGKAAKKKGLTYRLKNKDLKICWICWVWSDGLKLKKSEAWLLKDNPQIIETCEACKKWIAEGVSMICLGENAHTKEPCNAFYVLDEAMVQKYVPEAEKWSSFEIWGCPACSPDRKLHMTKQSVTEAYENFNK